jgi:toxin-antitoxin system PIN domain toxin
VIIPDINILVHAYNSQSPVHAVARRWWETTLERPLPVGLAWVVVLGFLRITTLRALAADPLPASRAVTLVRGWLSLPHVALIAPGPGHAETLFGLLERLGVAGNLTTDAHLAALAIEYQAELVSTDADFARFPGLRWFNPLALKK